jgi:hypothetical protein
MVKSIKRTARKCLNGALAAVGCEVVKIQKKEHDWGDVREFIPLEETLAGAREAGLSVGEYIDSKHNVAGATQATHDRLVSLGVFEGKIDRVCEIGPGSGRFLEKTIKACKPSYYEIYETAPAWKDWLVSTYKVTPQATDGITLASTPSSSIDLVQAHKVFVCLLFLNACSYFGEIARITRPGARVVFDVMTEQCIDHAMVPAWLKTGVGTRTYPAIMPRKFVLDYFQANGFTPVGSFIAPMNPGKTECMAFRKNAS